MYHKLPLDEAKTMPCILQHYHKSALTLVTCPWYNLDTSLSGLQTGHCKTQILMHSINNYMDGSRFSSQRCYL